jgi:hypothetical protein
MLYRCTGLSKIGHSPFGAGGREDLERVSQEIREGLSVLIKTLLFVSYDTARGVAYLFPSKLVKGEDA